MDWFSEAVYFLVNKDFLGEGELQMKLFWTDPKDIN